MRLVRKTKILLLLIFIIVSVCAQIPYARSSGASNNYCDAQTGLFSSTKSYSPPSAFLARENSATNWLKGMMNAYQTEEGDGSTITPDSDYKYDYTGPVSGSFSLSSSHPITSSTPLFVTSPKPIVDSYRGTVTGTATLPVPGSYEVRAFKYTDTEYLQPEAIPAVVQPDNSWELDLSPVPIERGGEWHFGMFNSDTDEQIGDYWPKPAYYTNLAIDLYSVVDVEYLSETIAASAENTFSFSQSYTGTKLIHIRNTSTEEILASYYEPSGLIRSYQYFPEDPGYEPNSIQRSYLYDQALALILAISQDDKAWADWLVEGLGLAQTKNGPSEGGFPFSVPQLAPAAADPIYRTGAQAIVTYSLLKYIDAYGPLGNSTQITSDALNYLQSMMSESGDNAGLYLGGTGRYVDDILDPDYAIPWASTEHNIDTWHTLYLASKVLHNSSYDIAAKQLKQAIVSKLWNPYLHRFNQGYNDTADALDINSWGAIFLNAVGEYDKAKDAMSNANNFKVTVDGTNGYTVFLAERGYAGAIDTVWFEGTYGVALSSFFINGLSGSSPIINNVINSQTAEGAWRYANIADPIYEIGSSRSVASTVWYLLSAIHPSGMWAECVYQPINYSPDSPSVSPSVTTNSEVLSESTEIITTNSSPIDKTDTTATPTYQKENVKSESPPQASRGSEQIDSVLAAFISFVKRLPAPVIYIVLLILLILLSAIVWKFLHAKAHRTKVLETDYRI